MSSDNNSQKLSEFFVRCVGDRLVPFTLETPNEEKFQDINLISIPNSLVMVEVDRCMLCNAKGITTYQCLIDYHEGWLYCKTCKSNGILKKVLLKYTEKCEDIPIRTLYRNDAFKHKESGTDEYSPNIYLKFFRYSQRLTDNPVYTGIGLCYDLRYATLHYSKTHKMYMLLLEFKNETSGQTMKRSCSLSNLFAWNPKLYSVISESKDLFEQGVDIGYNDLPKKLRDRVELAYKESQTADKYSFRY
jgi:hypothetical protein